MIMRRKKMKKVNRFLSENLGKHNDVPDDKFCRHELRMGIETEYEHTKDYEEAKAIAKDHLMELPDYYTKLKKTEEGGKEAIQRHSSDHDMPTNEQLQYLAESMKFNDKHSALNKTKKENGDEDIQL